MALAALSGGASLLDADVPVTAGTERSRSVTLSGVAVGQNRKGTKSLYFLDQEGETVLATEISGIIPPGEETRKYDAYGPKAAAMLEPLGANPVVEGDRLVSINADALKGANVTVYERAVELEGGGIRFFGNWILPARQALSGQVSL